MKTEEEIREHLEWLINSAHDKDNQTDLQQAKIWAQIDLIRWMGVER